MAPLRLSRTAAFVAAARALGAREPDAAARNPDYLAERLLGDVSHYDLDLPVMHALAGTYEAAMKDVEIAGTVCAMTVRTRFIDEALERAVAAGARQLLILGAGFDSHAYRCASLLQPLRVFEVDQPAMQAFKRERVSEVVGTVPANLRYVPVDFSREDLGALLRLHGYDFALPSFVIMEGVTMYLEEAALQATLRLIATHPAGSSVVFDFVSSVMLQMIRSIDLSVMPPAARPFAERFLHLTRDEPWQFGFPFRGEREYIEALGLSVGEILTISGEDAARRYLKRDDGTRLGGELLAAAAARRSEVENSRAEAMAYRIAEAFVPLRH
jgi:methyltransferase (TIGR00027 family)